MTADPTDVDALDRLREQLRRAEETGDPSLLAASFADDVIIMPPWNPAVEGRGACLEFASSLLAELMNEFERRVEITCSELIILGDTAIERGTFAQTLVPRSGDPPIDERGRYVWIHGRSPDGEWRVRRIIWNMESSSGDESPPPDC